MAESLITRQLKAAVEERGKMTPEALRDDLIRRGAIDAEGNVLVRGPQAATPTPPRAGKDRKAKRQAK